MRLVLKALLYISSYMASNNFVALFGMFVLYKTQIYLPLDIYTKYTRHFCAFRVVWRFFGFNSGCIAVVMATERWLALTRPFFYRKIVTQSMTVKTLIGFCIFAALLSVAPLTGFGAYFNETTNACVRYRDGRDPIDVAYAFTFFSFGNELVFSPSSSVTIQFGPAHFRYFADRVDCGVQHVSDQDTVRRQVESHVHKPFGHTISGGDTVRSADDLPQHILCGLLAAADDLYYHGAVLQSLGELS